MNNILMMGFELNMDNLTIARFFKHMGHDVTFQYIEREEMLLDEYSNLITELGIHCYGNKPDEMDWDLLSKELKTHTIVLMNPQLSETPAYDYARVYGRDVWCAVPDKDLHVTCDILFACSGEEMFDMPVEKRECVLVHDGYYIDYLSREGEIIKYQTNIEVEPKQMLVLMAGYIVALDKGAYVEEAMRSGLAMINWLQEENPLDFKEFPSNQGIEVKILE